MRKSMTSMGKPLGLPLAIALASALGVPAAAPAPVAPRAPVVQVNTRPGRQVTSPPPTPPTRPLSPPVRRSSRSTPGADAW